MDVAFDQYEAVTMLHAGDIVQTIPVSHADGASVDAVITADLVGIMPKGTLPQVEIDLPPALDAPIQAGQHIGMARLITNGVTIAEVPLVAANDIARDDFPARWLMYWRNWLGIPHA